MQFTKNGIHITVPDALVQGLVARAAINRLNDDHDDDLDLGIEVQPYEVSRASEAASSFRTAPSIGQFWKEQGGFYAGICRGRALGELDYHLIVGAEADDDLTWSAAEQYCNGLEASNTIGTTEFLFKDFTLPYRREQAVLFGNVPELFKQRAYWSSEQLAAHSHYAWYQPFYDGHQYYYDKSYSLRVRAVRRVPIQ